MKPTSSGYADVNGIKLYHEIYGQGEPLMLIHGGLTTIGEMQGWVQADTVRQRSFIVSAHRISSPWPRATSRRASRLTLA